jgi:hypothetical protein
VPEHSPGGRPPDNAEGPRDEVQLDAGGRPRELNALEGASARPHDGSAALQRCRALARHLWVKYRWRLARRAAVYLAWKLAPVLGLDVPTFTQTVHWTGQQLQQLLPMLGL